MSGDDWWSRCLVLDRKTGVCLFDHVWSWAGNSSTEGVANLLQSLSMIASSLGSDKIKTVVLEPAQLMHSKVEKPELHVPPSPSAPRTTRLRPRGSARVRGMNIVSLRRGAHTHGPDRPRPSNSALVEDSATADPTKVPLRVVFASDKALLCAIFQPVSTVRDLPALHASVRSVLAMFSKQFRKLLREQRDALEDIVDERIKEEVTRADILQMFAPFSEAAMMLYKKALQQELKVRPRERATESRQRGLRGGLRGRAGRGRGRIAIRSAGRSQHVDDDSSSDSSRSSNSATSCSSCSTSSASAADSSSASSDELDVSHDEGATKISLQRVPDKDKRTSKRLSTKTRKTQSQLRESSSESSAWDSE